jgi:hypothetical protein
MAPQESKQHEVPLGSVENHPIRNDTTVRVDALRTLMMMMMISVD